MKLTAVFVHWDKPLPEVEKQAVAWGFRGIQHLHKVDGPMDGNDARTQVGEIAETQYPHVRYFYSGNYCWAIGNTSSIYRCQYEEWVGARNNPDMFAVDWDQHTKPNE